MKLDPEIAKTIVENLKDTINHEINLIDTGGIIIASTDAKRIGTLHRGALKVVLEKKTVIVHSNDEFGGTAEGINLPLIFDGAVVAVVGITGNPNFVVPLGKIIQKMTEILMLENAAQLTRFNKQNHFNELVNMLVSEHRDESLVSYSFSVLDIARDVPRRVIIGQFLPNLSSEIHSYDELVTLLHNRLNLMPDSIFSTSNQRVCILLEDSETLDVNDFLRRLQKDIAQQLHETMTFGIGKVVPTANELWQSAKEADLVINWALFSQNTEPVAYENLDIQLLIANISPEIGQQYLGKIFSGLSEEEIDSFQEIFMAYVKHNGSISKGAEELYVHKNTFQNHLNKIFEKTGYNPRNLKDSPILYLAFRLRSYLGFIEAQKS